MSESDIYQSWFGYQPRERTGHSAFLNSDLEGGVTPLPSIIKSPSLDDCIEARLSELTDKNDICLLWSGGIDSTLAFYALVNSGVDFEVYGDHRSLAEHPELCKKIKSGNFGNAVWRDLSDTPENSFIGKNIITGEIGDQTVGSDYLLNMTAEYRRKHYTEKYSGNGIELFTDVAKEILNRSSMTVSEMTWAFNFFWKYDLVTQRIFKQLSKGDVHHFFLSDLFQCYAMNNYQDSTAFDVNTQYKSVYKDWIYKHDGDHVYRDHKTKINSVLTINV